MSSLGSRALVYRVLPFVSLDRCGYRRPWNMRLHQGQDLRPRPLCMDTPDMIMLVPIPPPESSREIWHREQVHLRGRPRRDTFPTTCLQHLSFWHAASSISTDAAWQTSRTCCASLRNRLARLTATEATSHRQHAVGRTLRPHVHSNQCCQPRRERAIFSSALLQCFDRTVRERAA